MKNPLSLSRVLYRCASAALPFGVLALAAARAPAQTAEGATTGGRGFSVVPTASVLQTFTDNGGLLSGPDKRSESITQGSVGIGLSSASGRIKGFFDYALTSSIYARDSDRNQLQNALNSRINAELIDNWVFVDVTGTISQQSISAFGTQAPDQSLSPTNSTEVASFTVSPYVRGRLGSFAGYEARLNYLTTQSRQTSNSDVTSVGATASVNGGTRGQGLSWSTSLSRQRVDFKEGRKTEDDTLRATLTYAVTPQLLVSVIAGRESNSYVSQDKESHILSGLTVEWTPSERTSFSGNYERRSFGSTHNVQFSYRTPRTVWSLSDSRNVSTGTGLSGTATLGNAYDLFFQQFASIEPDPVRRAQLVSAFLLNNGISPNSTLVNPFQASAVTLQRQQQLSVALVGVRNTLTFMVMQSNTQRLDTVGDAGSDLDRSGKVRQRGLSANLSHRFTPLSSGDITFQHQSNNDLAGTGSTTLRSISVNWNTRLNQRMDVSAGARFVNFDGALSPYTERAVFASIRLQF
jgi:uncharacterized protein (PEP-CTERM system associated)